MAKLKSLNPKNKDYAIKAYGLADDTNPAKITFKRWPFPGENFTLMEKTEIFSGVELDKSKRELAPDVQDRILKNYLSNLMASKTDYKRFFDECVDCFTDLQFAESKIITVNDFWQILPQDAAYTIAEEAYEYANTREQFTAGE